MHLLTRELTVNAVVAVNMIDTVEVILGMNVINAFGAVTVSINTKFGELRKEVLSLCSLLAQADCSSDVKLYITDRDFTADFDGYS